MQNPTEKADLSGWLVMIFGRVLGIGFAPPSLENAFRVANVAYRCTDPDFLTAFVDRLVDDDDRLMGFYVSAVSKSGFDLVNDALHAPYLKHHDGALEVWLSEAPMSEAHNAGEQAFGGRVFLGTDNTMAMTIDASGLLSPKDVEQLAWANAHAASIELD